MKTTVELSQDSYKATDRIWRYKHLKHRGTEKNLTAMGKVYTSDWWCNHKSKPQGDICLAKLGTC